MADLEGRVEKLEEKVKQLEIDINKSLGEIKATLGEIKASLETSSNTGDLKNQLIEKDVKKNSEDIKNLKDNQGKVVWTFVTAFLGLVIEAIVFYIRTK